MTPRDHPSQQQRRRLLGEGHQKLQPDQDSAIGQQSVTSHGADDDVPEPRGAAQSQRAPVKLQQAQPEAQEDILPKLDRARALKHDRFEIK